MRPVAILGIGQTKIDEHWDKALKELAGRIPTLEKQVSDLQSKLNDANSSLEQKQRDCPPGLLCDPERP